MKWDEDRDGDDKAQLVCDEGNESAISMRNHVARIGAKPGPGAPTSFKAPTKVLRNYCNQWRGPTPIPTPRQLNQKEISKRNIWILMVKKSWRTGQRIGTKNWNREPSSRRGEWRFISRAPHDHCWRSWWTFDWTIQQPVFWGRSYLGWKCHKLGFKVIFGS